MVVRFLGLTFHLLGELPHGSNGPTSTVPLHLRPSAILPSSCRSAALVRLFGGGAYWPIALRGNSNLMSEDVGCKSLPLRRIAPEISAVLPMETPNVSHGAIR